MSDELVAFTANARTAVVGVTDEVQQARARRNGGVAKQTVITTPEQWREALPDVIRRFKADMKSRYEEDA